MSSDPEFWKGFKEGLKEGKMHTTPSDATRIEIENMKDKVKENHSDIKKVLTKIESLVSCFGKLATKKEILENFVQKEYYNRDTVWAKWLLTTAYVLIIGMSGLFFLWIDSRFELEREKTVTQVIGELKNYEFKISK